MAKNHGARQQKKVAKQKAKRAEKRSDLIRRSSTDPSIRLHQSEKWPVVHTFVATELWETGIGDMVIARQEPGGGLIYSVFLVDVYCLGVKNAFWRAGWSGQFQEVLRKIETNETLSPISPACLVKLIKGAVEYAHSFGFRPHPDFRHAAALLQGIDPATCSQEFTYGYKGKPFYVQGPYETPEQVRAIRERIGESDGEYLIQLPGSAVDDYVVIDDENNPLALPEP